MRISDWRIGTRLGFLAGFLTMTMLVVGIEGWYTFAKINAHHVESMRIAALLESSVDTARSAQVHFKKQVQEWKDTLLRGNDPVAFDKYSQAFGKQSQETQTSLQNLKALFTQLNLDTRQVDEAIKTHGELAVKYQEALKHYDVNNPNSSHIVDVLVKGVDRPPTQKIDEIVHYILDQSTQMIAAANKKSESTYQTGKWVLLVTMLLAAVLGCIVTIWLVHSIVMPMKIAIGVAETVAAGNLTTHINTSGKDEIGQLMQALQTMNDHLVDIVSEVRAGTESIASASSQIAVGNLDLSKRTEIQAGSLQETSAAMEELTSTVTQNADNARQANQLAADASDVASRGGAVVSDVVSTMGEINESARKIADIIGVIDGIAFQTNILALNAAVEAARAGEQGRGFAVVATEVRSLAQRSATAAKEIKLLIDDSVSKVQQGNKQVALAGTTMEDVVSSVQRVTDIMSEISAASLEQSQGIKDINQAIFQMDETTQQNTALVEQAAAAAKSLQDQASNLENLVARFKLDDTHHPQQTSRATQNAAVSSRPAPTAGKAVVQRKAPVSKLIAAKSADFEGWVEF